METTKDERPVAKRIRNRNIFEDEEEFGAVVENFFMAEAKRQRRTGNLNSEKTIKSLPVEILVKIFNFLSNHDIRCGVSLACKEFYKICRDESLVPVKDLRINGGKKNEWEWRRFDAVSEIIKNSKDLTSLKINALNPVLASRLLSVALQSCPKLSQLEILDTMTKQISEYFRF